jgi:hypothetical protein
MTRLHVRFATSLTAGESRLLEFKGPLQRVFQGNEEENAETLGQVDGKEIVPAEFSMSRAPLWMETHHTQRANFALNLSRKSRQ